MTKGRESDMPEEELWTTFFDPDAVLTAVGLTGVVRDAVDFGCGYGTFTIPAARRVKGTVYALDIEPEMIAATRAKARAANLTNVVARQRHFFGEGTGLEPQSVDYAMLFNILHAEEPLHLLREAWRILRPGGRVGVIHWNYDPNTPRGPSLTIRPRPADCRRWIEEAGFILVNDIIDLPPYHYGLCGRKGEDK
ncbi:MAG: class I SAM-dependent methyltransferase [Planctomycetes bacterium]|nr:class I SAM-dependent methyltransferase [Planctomycetota bacterium]